MLVCGIECRCTYEVLCYKSNDPQEQPEMERVGSKKAALALAARLSKEFHRIEANVVYVDVDDENNWLGDDMLAVYENGKKVA